MVYEIYVREHEHSNQQLIRTAHQAVHGQPQAQSPSQVPQQGSRDSGCDEDEDGASQGAKPAQADHRQGPFGSQQVHRTQHN